MCIRGTRPYVRGTRPYVQGTRPHFQGTWRVLPGELTEVLDHMFEDFGHGATSHKKQIFQFFQIVKCDVERRFSTFLIAKTKLFIRVVVMMHVERQYSTFLVQKTTILLLPICEDNIERQFLTFLKIACHILYNRNCTNKIVLTIKKSWKLSFYNTLDNLEKLKLSFSEQEKLKIVVLHHTWQSAKTRKVVFLCELPHVVEVDQSTCCGDEFGDDSGESPGGQYRGVLGMTRAFYRNIQTLSWTVSGMSGK